MTKLIIRCFLSKMKNMKISDSKKCHHNPKNLKQLFSTQNHTRAVINLLIEKCLLANLKLKIKLRGHPI